MSDPQSRPTYDPNEIRRCIAVCFSPKDLRAFAENLGVQPLGPWDRGIQDGAREVVRHFERLGTLDELVAKLSEARPLVEWPAPIATTTATPFAPPPAPPATTPAETNPAPAPVPTSNAFAPQLFPSPNAPLPQLAPIKPAITPPIPAPEAVLRDPFAPSFPGTAGPSRTPPAQRFDGKKLAPFIAGGVALMTIIAIGIFLAVRVGKNPEQAPTETVAGRPLRPSGPARMAADAMKRSLESLARGCDLEIPRGTDIDVWLFSAAYAQCGTRPGLAFPIPGLRNDKPRSPDSPSTGPEPPETAPGSTPRQTNPGRDVAPRPAPGPAPARPPASDGCVDKCAATQRQCNRGCGSEPTSGAGFDRWQACQTQCLSTASKCRLACQ